LNAPNCFGWGSTSRHHWGSLQRSPDFLAGFKGPTSKGEGRRKRKWRGSKGREREGKGGKRREEI